MDLWQNRRVDSEDRRRNLWPLPGGARAYPETLRALAEAVGGGATRSELEELVTTLAPTVRSASTVRGYASVPVTLGLVERGRSGGALLLTPIGRRYAQSGDLGVLRKALSDRVFGVTELLDELAEGPSTCPELTERLAGRGVSWNHPMAVRYRVWWLVAAEAVDSRRNSRVDVLTLTPAGRRLRSSRAA